MAKKPRKATNPNETKRDKFIRLGAARTTRALSSINSIGKLATGSYEYTEDDVKRIHGAVSEHLEAAVHRLTARLTGGAKKSDKPVFSFTNGGDAK